MFWHVFKFHSVCTWHVMLSSCRSLLWPPIMKYGREGGSLTTEVPSDLTSAPPCLPMGGALLLTALTASGHSCDRRKQSKVQSYPALNWIF